MRRLINLGIILMLITAGYQSVISALVKAVAHDITTEVQVFAYYIIPLIFFIPILCKAGISSYKTARPLTHFLRGLFAASSVFCFFYTSQHIELGVAAVLFNSSPIFVPLLARIFLGEKTSFLAYCGIIISLVGIIIVMHPGLNSFLSPVAIIGLVAGFLMAVATIFLRYMVKEGESVNKIVFYLYLMCTLVTVVVITTKCIFKHNIVDAFQINMQDLNFVITILLSLGVISLIAQRTLTKAFQYMSAGTLMPFLYMSVPISSFIGWVFWRQQFTYSVAIGTLFVVSGVVIIMLEKQIKNCLQTVTKGKYIQTNTMVEKIK